MATFVQIVNGAVANVVVAASASVLPAGLTWNDITSLSPQPKIGWTYASGTYASNQPVPAAPTLAQQAAKALSAGLAITSASTPALNGTYITAASVAFGQGDLGTEAQFVSTFSEFTNGTTTLQWPLMNGSAVTFPNTAAFLSVAKAIAQYVAALKAIVATGTGALPAAAVQIA